MAEHSKFFDSLNPLDPDKVYTANEFIGYFGKLITDGIMKGEANMLKVETSGSNMNTTVDTGTAFLLAREYENDSKLSLTHEIEALGKSRIDRVVIRLVLDMDARYIKAFVKRGVAGVSPIAPPLERTGDVYEISLAQVKVIGGQTYINVADVVDERGKAGICPWAGSKILPNFDDASLEELMANQLTDGPSAKSVPNANANELTASGFYFVEGSGKTNFWNDAFTYILEVFSSGALVVQLSHIVNINSNSPMYQRIKSQNGWGPWERVGPALNNTLTSTSISEAATANTVKLVNDKVVAAENKLSSSSVALGRDSILQNADFSALALAGGKVTGNYGIAIGASSLAGVNSIALGQGANASNDGDGILGTHNGANTWRVPGSFSVGGTKQFEMPHPHPNKKATHIIRHGAVESPTAGDTLYRYTIEALADTETIELQLPDYFRYLNKDTDVYVLPHMHFGRAFGEVDEDILKVTCEKAGKYKVLIIGTRNDDHDSVQTWGIKGVEREIGESWTGETYSFEVDEIVSFDEITQEVI